jgi:hypothetical protein
MFDPMTPPPILVSPTGKIRRSPLDEPAVATGLLLLPFRFKLCRCFPYGAMNFLGGFAKPVPVAFIRLLTTVAF